MKSRISRLDRYLLSQLTRSTLFATLIALVVLLALQVLRLAPLIINQDLDLWLISRMISGLALSFVTLVIPISFTFAQLGVFGRMSSEKEFVALQAMGHSPFRLLRPCAWFGIVVTAMSLWASLSLSPYGNRIFDATVNEAYKRKVASVLRSGTFSEDFLDTVFFVENVNASTNDLDRVFMYDEAGLGPKSAISAKKGKWQLSQETGIGVLTLKNGVILSEEPGKDSVRRIKFEEYKINADFSSREGQSRNSPQNFTFSKLLEHIQKVQASESSPKKNLSLRKLWAEFARRFAVSFACLSLIPLCFGLSLTSNRTAKNRATMIGILILLLYWTVYFGFLTTYLKIQLPGVDTTQFYAWFFLWIPNFIALGLGYLVMRRRSRLAI